MNLPTSAAAGRLAVPPAIPGWPPWLLYAWVLGLAALPLLLAGIDQGELLLPEQLVDVRVHAVIELFCGLTALLIGGLMLAVWRTQHEASLLWFACGFLCMGGLDVLHALIPPGPQAGMFVIAHTLSTLSGGVLFCVATLLQYRRQRRASLPLWMSADTGFALLSIIALVLAYQWILPVGGSPHPYVFEDWAHRAHEFAALLYATAALLALLLYRETGQRLVLVAGAILLLFAESAYLFCFSEMWDTAWWSWHFVKVGLYLGSLVVIGSGLVLSLRAVQQASVVERRINGELRRTHARLDDSNRELRLRNTMVNASIGARGLDQTLGVIEAALGEILGRCDCVLQLQVGGDEVEEFRRGLQRQGLRWRVQVSAGPLLPPPGTALALGLRADGGVFGQLLLSGWGLAPGPTQRQQLQAIAAEIGPILHHALLRYRWNQALAFRAALLRVSAMLGSSLELPRVLEAVCGEGARLLASEASGVLLADPQGGDMRLVSHCAPGAGSQAASGTGHGPDWIALPEAQALFDALAAAGRPRALLRPSGGREAPPFPLGRAGCVWQALALFPMLDGERLIAVMLIMRRERVPFSAATLEQGELLAEQVRVALINARAYSALRDAHAQLQRAEQQRLRAERLAVLGRMAASVAHEVRNPLSAINNCVSVLRRQCAADATAVAPALAIIDDEVRRLDRLTHNFMSFGRAPRAAAARVPLADVVARVCERIRRHIEQQGLDIRLEAVLRGRTTPVVFDADGLQEVLWNLLLNAVQAMPAGRLRLRFVQRADHGFLAVADQGPGVPVTLRGQILEPFFSRRSEGAGLGLAIVAQHVEAWGGRLRVCGPPGGCFALRFPLAQGQRIDGEAVP